MRITSIKKEIHISIAALITLLFIFVSSSSLASERLNKLWSKQLDSPIHLPPSITEKYIIVTTSKGKVYCFEKGSGKLKWTLDNEIRFWDRSLIVTENILYIGSSEYNFHAYSMLDGKLLWGKKLIADVQARPLLDKDTLYVPTTFVGPELSNNPNGKTILYAINKNSGEILWQKQMQNYALQTPAIFNNTIYVAGSYYDPSIEIDEGGPMRVEAFNIKDGQKLWEYKSEDGFVKTVYANKKYVIYVAYQDYISALNTQDGTLSWRGNTGNWVPSFLGQKETVYYGSATTFVYSLSTKSGLTNWKFNISGGAFNYLLGQPVKIKNTLYFLTQKGDIVALESITGHLKWSSSTGVSARAGLAADNEFIAMGGIDGSVTLYKQIDEINSDIVK